MIEPSVSSLASRIGRALSAAFFAALAGFGLACAVVTFAPIERVGTLAKVRLGLNWAAETEHCGFFQAAATGLYRKAGLDVEIEPGGPDINLALLVAGGRVDLGVGDSFTTLNMVAGGVAAQTIAAFFQKDPQTLVVHAEHAAGGLEDLRGRPIMVGNYARQGYWRFLQLEYGFTDDQLRPYNFNPAVFIASPEAAVQGYVTEDGWVYGTRINPAPTSLLLADHGFDNYAQTVFGMRSWTAAHPDQVRNFLRATAQGYRECLAGDAPLARALVLARNPEHGEPLYRFKIGKMRELQLVTGGDAVRGGVGVMTDARWKHFAQTMMAAGLYPKTLNWRAAYTLDYLPSTARPSGAGA